MIQQLLAQTVPQKHPQQPRVSVIVVNLNRKQMLTECFQSLASQTLSPHEVILVDNGSTDGSLEVPHLFPDLHIRVIRNAVNQGFCAANNQGFAAATGDFYALLNNDAVAEPGWLAALAAAFETDPRIGMAASKILVYSQRDKIDKVGHLIYWDGQNRGRGSGQRDTGQFDSVEEILWPDGCAAMYRREMIDEIGGFDEDFFAYADDAELGLRGRLAGWRSLYMPDARVYHHRGSTLGVFSPKRIELIERNRILLVCKHFPWSLVWLNGVFYLLRVSAGVIAGLRGKGEAGKIPGLWPKLRSGIALLWGALRSIPLLPSMLRKRRQLRPLRRMSNAEIWRMLRQYTISLKELSEQSAA